MKRPNDVGADFDEYAKRWRKENYGLEAGYDAHGVTIDPERADQVQRPGDEWGDIAPLRQAYGDLVTNVVGPSGSVNVLEIGAGGGRSTAVVLDVLGDRVGEYHVVDVSAGFVDVLRERIDFPVQVHIVDDVNLSTLPAEHFDLCLAQSSWSHIGLYDQYRYLRELRRVLRPGAPIYVNGQFLLGVGNDWTWNRFVRRVDQIDRDIEGVYHEFSSFAALAEMLSRLQYDIECINTAGFIARRGERLANGGLASLPGTMSVPFNLSPHHFLSSRAREFVTLPDGAPKRVAAGESPETATDMPVSAVVPKKRSVSELPTNGDTVGTTGSEPPSPTTVGHDVRAVARKLLKRIPGVRSSVIELRRRRRGRAAIR